jgi:hypothetical protein
MKRWNRDRPPADADARRLSQRDARHVIWEEDQIVRCRSFMPVSTCAELIGLCEEHARYVWRAGRGCRAVSEAPPIGVMMPLAAHLRFAE